MTVSGFDGIDKHAKPEASLVEVLKKNAGRNSYGRITVRHRGGGEKRKYRIIDFKRDKMDMEATVLRLEYDPNRSANIALVQYEDGEKRYIVAPVGLAAGDKVQLVGFGTFERVERGEREGRNPQTGKTIKIPAKKAPKFTAGKALKDAAEKAKVKKAKK